MKKHLLFLFAALLPLVASAEKVEIDGIWYNLVSKAKQAEVTYKGDSYNSYNDEYSGSFTIPATVTYDGVAYSVTSIGEYAFYKCSSLKSITLPEGVTSIGYAAFGYCTSLTAITLPEGVTSIGGGAFSHCSSLTAINIPENSQLTSIGYFAFGCCTSLTAITIPEGVTSISHDAFHECTSLTAITIPEGVTSIEGFTFYDCSSLTAIVLPKSVKDIYSNAFANCPELTDVYCYAESVPSTEADAFDGSYPEYVTLHVPAGALETYKSKAPWSSFGTIVSLTEEKVTSITLNQSTATLTEGQTLTLIATVEPGYATNKAVTWSSTDFDVAAVDNNGKVTAIAPGTATITATANDGSGVSAQCEVTVEAATYVSITVNQYDSGTYCSEYALDFSNVEGLKAYAATGYNKKTKVVTLTRVMTTQPGEGLFIKGESGTYMVPIIEEADDNTLNMLVGTLTDTPVNAQSTDGLYANYKYTIKADESEPSFYQFADGSTLSAGKAYLQIPVAWLPATTEARSISLRFEEGEGTTDIENSEIKNQNSEFVYDLYGRRVDNPVKGSIYIVGGKKKVVK